MNFRTILGYLFLGDVPMSTDSFRMFSEPQAAAGSGVEPQPRNATASAVTVGLPSIGGFDG